MNKPLQETGCYTSAVVRAAFLGGRRRQLTLAGFDKKRSGGSLSKADKVTDWQEIIESALQHKRRHSSFPISSGLQDGSQGGTEAHEGKRARATGSSDSDRGHEHFSGGSHIRRSWTTGTAFGVNVLTSGSFTSTNVSCWERISLSRNKTWSLAR